MSKTTEARATKRLACTARRPYVSWDGTIGGMREGELACVFELDHDGPHMCKDFEGRDWAFPNDRPTRHVPRPLAEPLLLICHSCEARSGKGRDGGPKVRHRVVAHNEVARDQFLALHKGH